MSDARALNGYGGVQSLGSPDSRETSTGRFGSCGTRLVNTPAAVQDGMSFVVGLERRFPKIEGAL